MMNTKLTGREVAEHLQEFTVRLDKGHMPARLLDKDDITFLIKKSNLPANYVGLWLADFCDFLDAECCKFVNVWVKNFSSNFSNGKGILFAGPVGTGKSSLVTVILKHCFAYMKNRMIWEYLKKLNPSFYEPVPVFFWQASALIGDFYDDKDKFEKKASVAVLGIDDITKSSGERYIEALDYVIRKRELNSLPTLYTSQRPLKELEGTLGTPIFDLIKGNTTTIEVIGESRRGNRSEED